MCHSFHQQHQHHQQRRRRRRPSIHRHRGNIQLVMLLYHPQQHYSSININI